jgi:CDP-diglyceride synthetase
MKVTVKNILIGVVCIVIAQLLLAWLRSSGDLPLADWLESGIATGIAVIVWFALVARFGDKPA